MPRSADDHAVALIRVSNGIDSEHSPVVQARAVITYAADQGYVLHPDDILDENLSDRTGKVRKVSGGDSLTLRPKLERAIQMIEAGTHTVIISERSDRQFRNLDLQRSVIRRVEAKGGRLESPKGGRLSHATAEDEFHSDVTGAMASYQKRTATERSWDAVEEAMAQGRFPGKVVPGYLRDPDTRTHVADPELVPVMRRAFTMRAEGATFHAVRDYLAAHGIVRTRAGVQAMMASRQYVGELHFGKHTPNTEAHTGIINPDLFDRVQGMRAPAGGRRTKSPRLLARLDILHCGTCDGRMSASITGGRWPFYRCANDLCTRRMNIAVGVEDDIRAAVVAAHRDEQGQAARAARARQAAIEAEAARVKLDGMIDLLDAVTDAPATKRKLAALQADLDRKEARAAELAKHTPVSVTLDVPKVMATGSIEAQRSLITDTIERATVHAPGAAERVTIKLL